MCLTVSTRMPHIGKMNTNTKYLLRATCYQASYCTIIILDCPTLELPCNGLFVDVPANAKPGDFATYACLEGFEVDGNSTRICQDDYTWGGISPCCVRTCRRMYINIIIILQDFRNAPSALMLIYVKNLILSL